MKLTECRSVVQVGKWMQSKGITPGEHSQFGGVHPVHTQGSLHYIDQALDVNDNSPLDDKFRKQFKNEHDALTFVYFRILHVAEQKKWPLDEMFFSNFGFIKEYGYDVNHAIDGHAGHLHVGWTKKTW